MIIDVCAIPKDLLLLHLYNNALYQAPQFDILPTIRQKVAGKEGGMLFIASTLIKQNQDSFSEVDLGSGPRELYVNLKGFKVDFTQYDELHGKGTAQRIIRELREEIISELADENDNIIAKVMKAVNQELLNELKTQDNSMSVCVVSSAATSNEHSSLLSQLQACEFVLERYFADPVINDDVHSKALLKDLKKSINTHNISEKYKDVRVKEFYETWLYLINPNNDEQMKHVLCDNLFGKYTDKYASFANIVFHLPRIMSLEFLKYSNNQAIYALYQQRSRYKREFNDSSGDVQDYFADLVKMMTHSSFYLEHDKKHVLQHLLNFFHHLNELYKTSSHQRDLNHVKEALSCWIITNSLNLEDDIFQSQFLPEYIQQFNEIQLSSESIVKAIDGEKLAIRLDINRYVDQLILKQCLKIDPYNVNLVRLISGIDRKKIPELYQILLDCKLQPDMILSQYAISVVQKEYHSVDHPGLFISDLLPVLKSKLANKFQEFLGQFLSSVNPVFYAHDAWAFESIKKELLSNWSTQNPQQLIEAIKASMSIHSSTHETPIKRLVEGIGSQYFNDLVLNGLLTQLETLDFVTLFSVCSVEVQRKLILKLLDSSEPMQKILDKIREFNRVYPDSAFPTRFKEAFVNHLKEVNQVLFEQLKSEQLFDIKDQSDFERNLDNLKAILNNKQLKHDQRRSEIESLDALRQALRNDEDTCQVVMAMFKAIPLEQWPYLFVYFDTQIIHWSFPHDEDHLALLKRIKQELPKERTNTWLNNQESWTNILLSTLIVIADMDSNYSEEGNIAGWAMGHVQEALSKSATYMPDLPNRVLKGFFLADITKSMPILGQMTESSRDKYDINEKFIINDKVIASWLPEDITQRIQLLSSAFSSTALGGRNKGGEKLLETPFIRNDDEQRQLIINILKARQIHIINFLEQFTWDGKQLIIKTMYQIDPLGTEQVFVGAMNNVIEQIPANTKHYFDCINLLLGTLEYTEIDVFEYINKISNQQQLVATLSNMDFWNTPSANIAQLFRINSRLIPEQFYAKVTQYLQSKNQQYFSLYSFARSFSPAQKIAIPPYHSYADYLNDHPEEKDIYVQLLLSNIQLFIKEPNIKAIKLAKQLIHDLDVHIMKQLASEIKTFEQLNPRDNYEQKQRIKCLEELVQIYGAPIIINQCRAFDLEKQASYLEGKFKFYPQILNQIATLCKWFKVVLNPEYRKSDKIHLIEWRQIHNLNEKTLEVLLGLAESGNYPDYLGIDLISDTLTQICQKAEVSIDKFYGALPTRNDLKIELHTTGALIINGIFARDKNGNHLSKAGMKFANRYLSGNAVDLNDMEKDHNALDETSIELFL